MMSHSNIIIIKKESKKMHSSKVFATHCNSHHLFIDSFSNNTDLKIFKSTKYKLIMISIDVIDILISSTCFAIS